jgi:hypothetical protein
MQKEENSNKGLIKLKYEECKYDNDIVDLSQRDVKRYIVETVSLREHNLCKLLGVDVDENFLREFNFFAFYDLPIVNEDNEIIGNAHYFRAAIKANIRSIDVAQISGLDEANTIRFVVYYAYMLKKTHRIKFELLKFLKSYLKGTGRAWAEEIPGADMDDKLRAITGISQASIKLLMAIGNNNIDAFAEIDAGESSLRKEYNQIRRNRDLLKEALENDEKPSDTYIALEKLEVGAEVFTNFEVVDIVERKNSVFYYLEDERKEAKVTIEIINK